jgi:hypothetical protein
MAPKGRGGRKENDRVNNMEMPNICAGRGYNDMY